MSVTLHFFKSWALLISRNLIFPGFLSTVSYSPSVTFGGFFSFISNIRVPRAPSEETLSPWGRLLPLLGPQCPPPPPLPWSGSLHSRTFRAPGLSFLTRGNYTSKEVEVIPLFPLRLVFHSRDKPENSDGAACREAGHAALSPTLDEQHRVGGSETFAHGEATRWRRRRRLKRPRTYGDQQALVARRRLGISTSHGDGFEQSNVHDREGTLHDREGTLRLCSQLPHRIKESERLEIDEEIRSSCDKRTDVGLKRTKFLPLKHFSLDIK